jgi:hypothetical protein
MDKRSKQHSKAGYQFRIVIVRFSIEFHALRPSIPPIMDLVESERTATPTKFQAAKRFRLQCLYMDYKWTLVLDKACFLT